jgi:hypothetical protein
MTDPNQTDPLAQYQNQQQLVPQQVQHLQNTTVPTQTYYHAPPQSLPPQYLAELNRFWQKQFKEIESCKSFKNHELPLARIKKIMKSDEDVRVCTFYQMNSIPTCFIDDIC